MYVDPTKRNPTFYSYTKHLENSNGSLVLFALALTTALSLTVATILLIQLSNHSQQLSIVKNEQISSLNNNAIILIKKLILTNSISLNQSSQKWEKNSLDSNDALIETQTIPQGSNVTGRFLVHQCLSSVVDPTTNPLANCPEADTLVDFIGPMSGNEQKVSFSTTLGTRSQSSTVLITPTPSLCGYPVTQLTFPIEPYHIVFYTETFFNGNLGGIAGADAKCQTEAERPGSVVNLLKPGARWRAFLARPGKTLPDIGIVWQGDVYSIPMIGQSTAPRNNFKKIILQNGLMVGGRPPTQFCNYPNVHPHGGYHHWTGATSTGAPSVLNCSNWSSTSGSATAGDGGWGADWSDRFYDGSAAIHACTVETPLGCISE